MKMYGLKELKSPCITETVLRSLSQNRITTISDFLDEEITKLSAITKLDLSQVLTIRTDIFATFSAPLINGALLIDKVKNINKISTGIKSLDSILDGGILTGYITELCGLADSGKTQLCFQMSINYVKQSDNKVLYVDTKGDFSAVRIQKILVSCGCSPKEMAVIMSKIMVINIWNIEDLINLLKDLKNKTIFIENLGLIIIDSLPSLMFQYLGEDNKIGLSFLNRFVNYARYLCMKLNLALICVNIQTRWVDMDTADLDDEYNIDKEPVYIEKRNRCLGKYWHHIPALVLQLEKINDSNSHDEHSKVEVTVMKSNSVCNFSQRCNLCISGIGVT